ncbi:MAG: 50S ribosomal protein L17 [Bacteroidetes bacterium]|nr:50S ribosomal protein L17 [Bacteroidota bacterium]MBU1677434.1 50S ribosomal protein L17 [Bacteroidota bacterium]MBU2506163.1 50S ribosomal protein L17 [Bacteroidota bacterium]
MRHKVKGRKLGRTASHRLATLKSLATSLLSHKKIKTTVAKAKELRSFVEPMITRAKEDSVHNRRHIAKFFNDKALVQELFGDIVAKIGDRKGGYTRVVKLGRRLGDAAEMAIIELVDFNDLVAKKKTTTKKNATKKADKVEIEDAKVVEEKVDKKAKDADKTEKKPAKKADPKTEKKAAKTTKKK